MILRNTVACLALLAFAACQSRPQTDTKEPETQTMPSNKDRTVALLESIQSGDHGPAAVLNPERYRQHNLSVADGVAGFGAVLAQLPKGSARVRVVRAFEDGDFVFTHTEYDFFGPKIGFDVFRFEEGKIVEHWDNLQETPKAPNPSGRSMIDGPAEPKSPAATEKARALVRTFLEDVLVNGQMDKLAGYLDADNYVQHNPHIADGLSGLSSALQAMAKQGVTMKYDKVHRVLAQGEFALAMSEGSFGGKPTSFYDLFRVEGDKIVEHWDVLETIPPRAEWKNDNGKF